MDLFSSHTSCFSACLYLLLFLLLYSSCPFFFLNGCHLNLPNQFLFLMWCCLTFSFLVVDNCQYNKSEFLLSFSPEKKCCQQKLWQKLVVNKNDTDRYPNKLVSGDCQLMHHTTSSSPHFGPVCSAWFAAALLEFFMFYSSVGCCGWHHMWKWSFTCIYLSDLEQIHFIILSFS